MAGPAIMVSFEPEGEALLHEGKVKEALASYRGLISANPNDAVHHLQVARVLLQAGMGEAARAEAREGGEAGSEFGTGGADAGGHSEARPGGPRPSAGNGLGGRGARLTGRRRNWIRTITRRRGTWRFCWSMTRWAGGTADRQT